MTAYIEFQNVLKKLENKKYVKVILKNNDWHYMKIGCIQKSVVNKLKEYLDKIDEEDYFYGTDGFNNGWIYLFNTRVFVEDFNRNAMKGDEDSYFTWDKLDNNNYTFYYPLRKTFMRILEPKGYKFEHPHNSGYCHCWNVNMIEERKKREEQKRKEVDDFLKTL